MRVLVVADPAADSPLPGAQREGMEVADLFESFNAAYAGFENTIEVHRLIGPRQATRTEVLRRLLLRHYDALHYAGHCFFNRDNPAASGWIFGNGEVLSAFELRRIDRIPKFVFSNACESGITPDRSGRRDADLAPSFAEAFFERGVSNFVCTAWPVDDQAALTFALTLYRKLLGLVDVIGTNGDPARLAPNHEPKPMHVAMREARLSIADDPGGAKTWGAYQHYGYPYFAFFDPSGMKKHADQPPPKRKPKRGRGRKRGGG